MAVKDPNAYVRTPHNPAHDNWHGATSDQQGGKGVPSAHAATPPVAERSGKAEDVSQRASRTPSFGMAVKGRAPSDF